MKNPSIIVLHQTNQSLYTIKAKFSVSRFLFLKDKNKRLEEGKVIFFVEFPTCVAENSAHAGSVILDCILSLDSGFIDDNSALRVLFCDLSTLYQSNPMVTKMLHLLAKEIYTQIRNSVWDSTFTHVVQRFVGTNFLLNIPSFIHHCSQN